MIRYLLDTNICIELIRGRDANVLKRMKKCAIGEVGLSAITLAELEHGVMKSSRPEQNSIALDTFCAPLEICPFDSTAARAYGDIRTLLERRGQVIGPLDLLIAVHALSQGAVLITNNEREFRRIKDLAIENWL